MFGIQPLIARDAHGRALYSPFGLKVAVPAMAIEHLLIFGFVEAVVTGLVVAYVQRTEPSLIRVKAITNGDVAAKPSLVRQFVLMLIVLALLAPIGLWLPAMLGSGSAWGEWSAQEIARMVGYTPGQLERVGSLWSAPLPDYSLGAEGGPLWSQSLAYVFSGITGAVVVVAVVLLVRKATSAHRTRD